MTTNKRFKNVEEKLEWGTIQYFTYHDEKITDEELEKLVNHLLNQNDELNDENEKLNNQIQELYQFRLLYNAHLFNEWAENGKYEVYKSKKHDTGDVCFDGEWFIVVAILPTGQITNHYNIKDWDLFKIPSIDKVKDKFDGHTSTDVLDRLKKLILEEED